MRSSDPSNVPPFHPSRPWIPLVVVPAFAIGLLAAIANGSARAGAEQRWFDHARLGAQGELVAQIQAYRARTGRCPLATAGRRVSVFVGHEPETSPVGTTVHSPMVLGEALGLDVHPPSEERRSVVRSWVFHQELVYETDARSFTVSTTLSSPHEGTLRLGPGRHRLAVGGTCARRRSRSDDLVHASHVPPPSAE